MKHNQLPLGGPAALFSILLFSTRAFSAAFVEVKAEIETSFWSYKDEDDPPTVGSKIWKVNCVVGTNSWLIAFSTEGRRQEKWWYTGSNLVWQVESGDAPGGPLANDADRSQKRSMEYSSRTFPFEGNVEGGKDRVLLLPQMKLAWLAFCSGPFLKRDGREIPLPSDFWKETALWRDHAEAPLGFKDQTIAFEDDLGLPRNIDVFTKRKQPIFQYRVAHGRGPSALATNVLGWEFPLEFHAVQYLPATSNTWQVYFIAKGMIQSAQPAKEPHLSIQGPQKTD